MCVLKLNLRAGTALTAGTALWLPATGEPGEEGAQGGKRPGRRSAYRLRCHLRLWRWSPGRTQRWVLRLPRARTGLIFPRSPPRRRFSLRDRTDGCGRCPGPRRPARSTPADGPSPAPPYPRAAATPRPSAGARPAPPVPGPRRYLRGGGAARPRCRPLRRHHPEAEPSPALPAPPAHAP